jgi:linoleoyl-CoA desaturase
MSKVTFNNKNTVFFSELKARVDKYFQEKGVKKTGDWRLFHKTLVLIPLALTLYIALMVFNMPFWAVAAVGIAIGITKASIGFNVMHDACHGSYSSKKWVNNLLGLTLNAMGGTAFIWKQKHNIIHHTYTNVDGLDDDIAKSPLIRQCHTQKWVPMHRVQHLYLPLVYSITSFAWTFIMDFTKYFSKKVYRTPLQKMNATEHFIFWLSKVLNIFFYIVLPVIVKGWGVWAIFYVSMHVWLGLTLALVFQLAHVVEHTEFETVATEAKVIENEWAIHQIKTTANFATGNKIINWYVGGLNFQVEHHLFPRISHVHYPALSKIVQEVCTKHNIAYHNYPTMWSAVVSHFKFMKELGKRPDVLPTPAY